MELAGERVIPASIDRTWASLSDPGVLRTCIAGARFEARPAASPADAPKAGTIDFGGQGSVDVALTPGGEQRTLLKYAVRAMATGDGARADPTPATIAESFFSAFEAQMRMGAVALPAPAVATSEADGSVARLWWLIGGVVVLALVYFLIRK